MRMKLLTQTIQQVWMKRGKTLDAEDLQNKFGTLIDVAELFSSCSTPMNCRVDKRSRPHSLRPIALPWLKSLWREACLVGARRELFVPLYDN